MMRGGVILHTPAAAPARPPTLPQHVLDHNASPRRASSVPREYRDRYVSPRSGDVTGLPLTRAHAERAKCVAQRQMEVQAARQKRRERDEARAAATAHRIETFQHEAERAKASSARRIEEERQTLFQEHQALRAEMALELHERIQIKDESASIRDEQAAKIGRVVEQREATRRAFEQLQRDNERRARSDTSTRQEFCAQMGLEERFIGIGRHIVAQDARAAAAVQRRTAREQSQAARQQSASEQRTRAKADARRVYETKRQLASAKARAADRAALSPSRLVEIKAEEAARKRDECDLLREKRRGAEPITHGTDPTGHTPPVYSQCSAHR